MREPNGLGKFREGLAKGAAAVVLGPLALTGCSATSDANRQPTVAASPASVEPSPEATPTATPTPEQTFDPSSDKTEIEIGNDVIGNYYEQISKIDQVLPDAVTLADVDGGDNPATLKIAANSNSYNISGINSDLGLDFYVTVMRTDRKVVVKRPGYNDINYQVLTQILNASLPDGTSVSAISDFGLYDNGMNSLPWKDILGQSTTNTANEFNTGAYGLRYLEKQVADYNQGGTNRVGETVEPSSPVTMVVDDYTSTNPIRISNPKAIATILITGQDGNTIGVRVSNNKADLSGTDTKISNISPAEIAKLAKQYNLTVSFEDPDSLPKDDIELYDIVKSSLDSLPAAK